MLGTVLSQRWYRLRARYARPESPQDLELPTRRNSEFRDGQHHPGTARHVMSSTRPEDSKAAAMKVTKKSCLLSPQRWTKSLRALRLVAWPLAFIGRMFVDIPWSQSTQDIDNRYTAATAWTIPFGSLFMAWDIWRILQSLYKRAPGYRTEIILTIEICILVALITSIANDISLLIILSAPPISLLGLPAVLLSTCIVGRHVWRYPARRRERIRYATIKPRVAFTASGIPVAVYPTRVVSSEIELLSIDSLQEHPDSQADQPEHHRSEYDDATGYTNESQVSLLSEQAATSFAIHGEIGTAVHRPIQPTQWLGDSSQ